MNLSRTVSTAPAATALRPSRAKRWLVRCGVMVLLMVGIWLLRAPLLRGAARAWIVTEAPTQADAAVVLGGGLDIRPFAAANLYSNHVTPAILVINVQLEPVNQMGLARSHTELNRDVLLKLGVPAGSIHLVGENVTNTREEALAVRDWAHRTGAHHVIVATDIFHTRRVRWLFNKVLKDQNFRVTVIALQPRQYSQENWWQHEAGLISFQNEVVKYLLYRWKY